MFLVFSESRCEQIWCSMMRRILHTVFKFDLLFTLPWSLIGSSRFNQKYQAVCKAHCTFFRRALEEFCTHHVSDVSCSMKSQLALLQYIWSHAYYDFCHHRLWPWGIQNGVEVDDEGWCGWWKGMMRLMTKKASMTFNGKQLSKNTLLKNEAHGSLFFVPSYINHCIQITQDVFSTSSNPHPIVIRIVHICSRSPIGCSKKLCFHPFCFAFIHAVFCLQRITDFNMGTSPWKMSIRPMLCDVLKNFGNIKVDPCSSILFISIRLESLSGVQISKLFHGHERFYKLLPSFRTCTRHGTFNCCATSWFTGALCMK